MAKLMFGQLPALGLILAPLMVYHLFQLTASSFIARRFAVAAAADSR
jgi:sodium/bile acid cotransporter 7